MTTDIRQPFRRDGVSITHLGDGRDTEKHTVRLVSGVDEHYPAIEVSCTVRTKEHKRQFYDRVRLLESAPDLLVALEHEHDYREGEDWIINKIADASDALCEHFDDKFASLYLSRRSISAIHKAWGYEAVE